MKYEEAEKIFGNLIRPKEAAEILKIKQPSINGLWKRKTIKKIEIERENGKKTFFCIKSEIEQYKIKKESKKIKKQPVALVEPI